MRPPAVFSQQKTTAEKIIMRIYYKTHVFMCFSKKTFVVYHDQGHDQGPDHDQGHDQGHDHDQGGSGPGMIMTLIMTLIMINNISVLDQ